RIHERAARMTGRGMHRQAGRLVEDDDIAVLVDDGQRDRFRLEVDSLRRRDRDVDDQSRGDALRRLRLAAVYRYEAFVDQAAGVAARKLRTAPRDKGIEPFTAPVSRQLQRSH